MKTRRLSWLWWCPLLILVVALIASPAQADDTNWTGDIDNDWFVSGNWDNGVPTDSLNAFINNGGWPYISSSGAQAQNLTLGSGSTDSGSLDINNGLTVGGGGGGGGVMTLGDAGLGTAFVYSGTLQVTGDLILGAQSYSAGYFENQDTTTVGGNMVVGNFGNGDAYNWGSLAVTGDLILAAQSYSGGYFANWATTTVGGKMVVGDAGSGSAYIGGGTLGITGDLILGNQTGSYGYMENWAAITVGGHMTIGAQGSGDFYHYAGSLAVSGNLTVGDQGIGTLQVGGDNNNPTLNVGTADNPRTMIVGNVAATQPVPAVPGVSPPYHGRVTQYDGEVTVYGNVVLGQNSDWYGNGPAYGFYDMYGGSLTVNRDSGGGNGNLYVGDAGIGNFYQKGGAVIVQNDLIVGNQSGSQGTYNLSSGTLNVGTLTVGGSGSGIFNLSGDPATSTLTSNYVYIGYESGGVGTFTQSGGTHTINNIMVLGHEAGSQGTYTLQTGGVLNAQSITVGLRGTGNFNLEGGQLSVNDTLSVADDPGSGTGTFKQTGGTANVNNLLIGRRQVGTYNFSGGSMTANYMGVGEESGSTGTVNMSDTAQLTVTGGNIEVGNPGVGTFNQSGGTVTTVLAPLQTNQPSLILGRGSGEGTYNLSGSASLLDVGGISVGFENLGTFTQTGGTIRTGNIEVGALAGSNGSMVQSGGTVVIDPAAHPGSWEGALNLGRETGSVGSYEINQDNGTATLTTGSLVVGRSGTGTFTQKAGTVNVTNFPGQLIVGSFVGSNGTYNLDGGSLNVISSTTVGREGTGTFTQKGGDHLVTMSLILGNSPSGSGTYNLDGGTLTVGRANVGWSGTGIFNQNGGTLTVTGITGPPSYSGDLMVGRGVGSNGTYTMTGGTINAENLQVGMKGTGSFTQTGTPSQTGGSVTVTNAVNIGTDPAGSGTYTMDKGTLTTKDLTVGSSGSGAVTGTLALTTALAQVNVGGNFTINERGQFTAASGVTINMTGANFYNNSHDPSNVDMTGLRMFFSNSGASDTFEVAGHDYGATMAGFTNNFALGTLELGAGVKLTLLDDVRNLGPDPEALYVYNLILGPGSILDPDIDLYYVNLINNGGTFGGNVLPQVVPLPGSVWLLLSGLAGLWGVRRFRS